MIHTEPRPDNKYYSEDEYKYTKFDYLYLSISAVSVVYILYLIVTGH